MFKSKVYVISVLLLCGTHIYGDFGAQFADVQGQYEKALQQLIVVYNDQTPPKPVEFAGTDALGSAYYKVIHPYVLELAGYAGVVMSAYARQFPYYDNLETLQKKFDKYNKEVVSLSKKFAKKYQEDALIYFYNQLTTSVLQNCAQILQDISYKLDTKKESLQAAKTAYQLAWAVQTPTMKLKTFSGVKEFQENMTTWITNLYQAAISDLTESLQNASDKQPIYNEIASHYEVMASIYKTAQNNQQASIEMENATKAKQSAQQFVQAENMIKEADKLAEEGRAVITIDFSQPAATKESLVASLQALQKAQALYTNASRIYTAVQDNNGITLCTAKTSELAGDTHVRGIQLLWTLFLEDSYRQGVSSEVKAYEVLKIFFAVDPTQNASTIAHVEQALQDVIQVCTKAPNNYNESLAMVPLLQGAIEQYNSATSSHPHGHSNDRLANVALLNDLSSVFTDFVSLLQNMIALGAINNDAMSPSTLLVQAVVQAKKIDTAMSKNKLLANFFVNFADFITQVTEQKSLTSFVIQYMYRVVMSAIEVQFSKSNVDDKLLMQLLSYLIALQGYKSYVTAEQWGNIEQSTKKIVKAINLKELLTSQYNKARQRSRWQNTSHHAGQYQSVSNSLWQNAIQLYQVAIQLALTDNATEYNLPSLVDLQKKYLEVLQEYVTIFLQKGPKSEGYQLYMLTPLYELHAAGVGTDSIGANAASYAAKTLQNLFGGKDGFFSTIKDLEAQQGNNTKGSAKTSKKYEAETKNLLAMLALVIEQEEQAASTIQTLFQLSKQPEMLLEKKSAGEAIIITMSLGDDNYTARITNPIAVTVQKYSQQADTLLAAAEEDEKKLNYADAMKSYETLQQIYIKILPLVSSSSSEQEYKNRYFLAKTRYTATSLAASVAMSGSLTAGKMTNIPEQYHAIKYVQHGLNVTDLGSQVPSSLQGFTKMTTMETDAAHSLALDLLKAFITSQLLSQQGLKFTDCYTSYQMQEKSDLSDDDLKTVKSVALTVNNYFKLFDKVTISLMVSGNTIVMEIQDMPIPAVTPMYPGAPYAGLYFAGASTLFAPGEKLLQIGGASYVPGQDEDAAFQMYDDLGNAYLSEAQQSLTKAQLIIEQLFAAVSKEVKAGNVIDAKNFNNQYNQAKQLYVRAQSLLMASGGSAFYYFNKAKQSGKAAEVKSIFLNSFKNQIDEYKKLLLGNPVSDTYNLVVSDINQAYLSWSSELDPKSDASLIADNEKAVVDLYVNTAQACLQYRYTQKMYPHFKQYHYMTAADNYKSASKQYQNMQDTELAGKMTDKVMEAYFLGSVQNLLLYYSVKKHGVVYTPMQILGSGGSVNPKHITYKDLIKSYQEFQAGSNVNPGETAAYTTVKDLLVTASMFLQLVSGHYQKKVKPNNNPQQANTNAKGKSDIEINDKLLKYLTTTKKVFSPKLKNVPYTKKGMLEKLFNVGQDVFLHFYDDPAVLVAWCNILNMAVTYQYIDDYEGGISTSYQSEKSGSFEHKTLAFSQAVQKEASALQNPSSAYVG